MNWNQASFPSLKRRGGCAIKKMSRSNLSSRRRGGQIGEIFRPEEFRRTDQRVRRWPSRRLPFVAAGVDSPDLPACIFHAPGDPAVIAPEEGRYRNLLSW